MSTDFTRPITLMSARTTTGSGDWHRAGTSKTLQALGTTSAGVGAATIVIEVSNDGTNALTAGTITLTLGTSATSDGFASFAAWLYVRANVTAISGTNAQVSVYMGADL